MPTFGERVRALRLERGLTQSELATALTSVCGEAITRSAESMWESNQRRPKYETMEALAAYFQVDVAYLTGRSEQRRSAPEAAAPESGDEPPEITLIARAGKKMSPDQRDLMLRWAKMTFPEAFADD